MIITTLKLFLYFPNKVRFIKKISNSLLNKPQAQFAKYTDSCNFTSEKLGKNNMTKSLCKVYRIIFVIFAVRALWHFHDLVCQYNYQSGTYVS